MFSEYKNTDRARGKEKERAEGRGRGEREGEGERRGGGGMEREKGMESYRETWSSLWREEKRRTKPGRQSSHPLA